MIDKQDPVLIPFTRALYDVLIKESTAFTRDALAHFHGAPDRFDVCVGHLKQQERVVFMTVYIENIPVAVQPLTAEARMYMEQTGVFGAMPLGKFWMCDGPPPGQEICTLCAWKNEHLIESAFQPMLAAGVGNREVRG